nr:uncharacterized protein LOC119170446 [Rhipicephalus microplus]
MTGIQVVSWVKPKAVLSLASEWSSWCQQDLGAPTRLLWPVCRGHGRRVSASLGLLEVRGVTLTCSGHSLHPLPAGRPEHEDSSPLSRRTALPVVHLWIALPGHCKVCQEYHSSQPEVSAALERTCAVPRLLDYHRVCSDGEWSPPRGKTKGKHSVGLHTSRRMLV